MTPTNTPSKEPQVLTVLQANAESLLTERAKDWEAVLLFEVTDVGPFTMNISDGVAQVTVGSSGVPTCIVKLSAETLVGLGTGKVEGPKAFMQGQITATNMVDMMRFATSFDGRKVARLVQERLSGHTATSPEAEPEGSEGLNKRSIGWTYDGEPTVADLSSIQAFVRATGDNNLHYVDDQQPQGVIAPPMYVVRPMKETLFKPLLDPRVNANLLLLLHGEQDMRFYELLRPGDAIQTRSQILEILDKASGQLLKLRIHCDRKGVIVAEALVTLFIRSSRQKPQGEATVSHDTVLSKEQASWSFEEPITVEMDQPLRYAEASLDNNPIHTEPAVAQAAGLRTIVLQGLCTMAFCQRVLINTAADGDPGRLKRLKVRFAQPVFPGDQLMLQGRYQQQPEGKNIEFRVINQEGVEVITSGVAEILPPPA